MEVLLQVAAIFILLLMGVGAVKWKVVDSRGVSAITTLVLYFAQPCMILSSMRQDVTPELLRELVSMFFGAGIVMVAVGFFAWWVFRNQPHDRRAVFANLVMTSNCGFMGYPIVEAALNKGAIIYAVVYVVAFNAVTWTLGTYFFRGKSAVSPKKIFTNPSVLAVLAGLVMLLTGFRLPGFMNTAIDAMGNITTPVAMFVIGGRLVGLKPKDLTDKHLLLACGMRLLAVPLAVFAALYFLPLTVNVKSVLFICCAMPGASLVGMQADLYDCEKELASRGVAISTALSMATVPLLLLLL